MSLISGLYFRGDPKQKPKQWGPLSSVHSYIIDRCRFIGAPNLFMYSAFWENAGSTTIDLKNNRVLNFSNHSWQKGSVLFNNTTLISEMTGPYGTGSISYGCMLKFSTTDAINRHVFNIGLPTANNMTYMICLSGRIKFGAWGFDTLSDGIFADNKWHSVFVIYNGLNFKLYVDGVSIKESIAYSSLNISAAPIVLGNYRLGGSYYYSGYMDSPWCFDGAVSEYVVEFLNENPYYLIQPPTFRTYFDFGSIAPSISCNLLAAAAQATRIIQ